MADKLSFTYKRLGINYFTQSTSISLGKYSLVLAINLTKHNINRTNISCIPN